MLWSDYIKIAIAAVQISSQTKVQKKLIVKENLRYLLYFVLSQSLPQGSLQLSSDWKFRKVSQKKLACRQNIFYCSLKLYVNTHHMFGN